MDKQLKAQIEALDRAIEEGEAQELVEDLRASLGKEPARLGPQVSVFGAPNYQSHLLPDELLLSRELLEEFERELKGLLDHIWDTYEEKGKLYDQATPVWHHFAFGLTSFASMMFLKATRFISLMQQQAELPLAEIEDTLRDLTVYAWYAWAYARMQSRRTEQ